MKVLRLFLGVVIVVLWTACENVTLNQAFLQCGVSQELAHFRKAHFDKVCYNLFFSIPELRQEAVTGKVELSFCLKEQHPVI